MLDKFEVGKYYIITNLINDNIHPDFFMFKDRNIIKCIKAEEYFKNMYLVLFEGQTGTSREDKCWIHDLNSTSIIFEEVNRFVQGEMEL